MKNVDKIILSQDRASCTVYFVHGGSFSVVFSDLKMNYLEGLKWLERSFNGTAFKAS